MRKRQVIGLVMVLAALSAWAECLQVDLRDTNVKVHVVYPGVIDTELFTLPDNDPLGNTGVEMLPVDAMVEPVLTTIEQDKLEVAVPEWFGSVFAGFGLIDVEQVFRYHLSCHWLHRLRVLVRLIAATPERCRRWRCRDSHSS